MMHDKPSARCFFLACWFTTVVLGVASCGGERSSAVHVHHTEALDEESEFAASDNHRFSWQVEWLSGSPVATREASARLTFQNAQGAFAGTLVVTNLDLIMVCCRESGSKKPQLETESGMNPAVRDAGHITPTKSGRWKLQVTAEVDGAETDTASWVFDVAAP